MGWTLVEYLRSQEYSPHGLTTISLLPVYGLNYVHLKTLVAQIIKERLPATAIKGATDILRRHQFTYYHIMSEPNVHAAKHMPPLSFH